MILSADTVKDIDEECFVDEVNVIDLGGKLFESFTGDVFLSYDAELVDLYGLTGDSILVKKLPECFESNETISILADYLEKQSTIYTLGHGNLLTVGENISVLAYSLPAGEMLSTWLEREELQFDQLQVVALLTQLHTILEQLSSIEMQHGMIEINSLYICNNGDVYLLDSAIVAAKHELIKREILPFHMVPNSKAITASPEVCFGHDVTELDNVFNLSLLTCQLLSGQHPFDGKNSVQALMGKGQAQCNSGLKQPPKDILQQGLLLKAENRLQTVEELIGKLSNTPYTRLLSPSLKVKNIRAVVDKQPKKSELVIEIPSSSRETIISKYGLVLLAIILGNSLGSIAMFFLLRG